MPPLCQRKSLRSAAEAGPRYSDLLNILRATYMSMLIQEVVILYYRGAEEVVVIIYFLPHLSPLRGPKVAYNNSISTIQALLIDTSYHHLGEVADYCFCPPPSCTHLTVQSCTCSLGSMFHCVNWTYS